jgi:hypothetical protein
MSTVHAHEDTLGGLVCLTLATNDAACMKRYGRKTFGQGWRGFIERFSKISMAEGMTFGEI